jgi:hypothetical protein
MRKSTQINYEKETNGQMQANICRNSLANETGICHQVVKLLNSLMKIILTVIATSCPACPTIMHSINTSEKGKRVSNIVKISHPAYSYEI